MNQCGPTMFGSFWVSHLWKFHYPSEGIEHLTNERRGGSSPAMQRLDMIGFPHHTLASLGGYQLLTQSRWPDQKSEDHQQPQLNWEMAELNIHAWCIVVQSTTATSMLRFLEAWGIHWLSYGLEPTIGGSVFSLFNQPNWAFAFTPTNQLRVQRDKQNVKSDNWLSGCYNMVHRRANRKKRKASRSNSRKSSHSSRTATLQEEIQEMTSLIQHDQMGNEEADITNVASAGRPASKSRLTSTLP